MAIPTKHQTSRPIHTAEEAIESLAELAGFKVYQILDKNNNILGYTLQPEDKDLDEFINAEFAAEEYENELVSAMASFGDDY